MKIEKAIITSCSARFFPSLINLLGSLESNYPNHPQVFIYDLGLTYIQKKELNDIKWVTVLEVPHFVIYWVTCYTWKTYVLNNPIAKLNLYLDAGNEVLRNLDDLFETIEKDGYLFVSQGKASTNADVTPVDYVSKYNISNEILKKEVITAGIVGFQKDGTAKVIFDKLYKAGVDGDCLGYSKKEFYKSKGINKTNIVRDCKIFRHDTTLLSIISQMEIPSLKIHDLELFSNVVASPRQYIHNLRLNYSNLNFVNIKLDSNYDLRSFLTFKINRLWIYIYLFLKNLRHGHLFVAGGESVIKSIFGEDYLDSLHSYPSKTSNIRYYHFLKSRIVKLFIHSFSKKELSLKILDIGAGRGPYSRMASNIFKSVYYDEYNEEENYEAKKNLDVINNIIFNRNDLTETEYKDNYFDVIICSEVLEHINNREKALTELYRILKPGGDILISMPQKNSLFYRKAKINHSSIFKIDEESLSFIDWEFVQHFKFNSYNIETLVDKAGFTIIKKSGANIIPVGEKIFSTFYYHCPLFLYLYIKSELLLEKILPRYCSFYFVHAKKN